MIYYENSSSNSILVKDDVSCVKSLYIDEIKEVEKESENKT